METNFCETRSICAMTKAADFSIGLTIVVAAGLLLRGDGQNSRAAPTVAANAAPAHTTVVQTVTPH